MSRSSLNEVPPDPALTAAAEQLMQAAWRTAETGAPAGAGRDTMVKAAVMIAVQAVVTAAMAGEGVSPIDVMLGLGMAEWAAIDELPIETRYMAKGAIVTGRERAERLAKARGA